MKTKISIFASIIIAALFSSCEDNFISQEYENNPVDVFDCMWNEYDKLYALFEVKNINWDSIYNVYRPMVSSSSTDDGLFSVLTSMLANLNDNHVRIYAPGRERFVAGILYHLPVFPDSDYEQYSDDRQMLLDLVKSKYLESDYVEPKSEAEIIYGKISSLFSGQKSIGYFYIGSEWYGDEQYIDDAFAYFIANNCDALIVDIRINDGGEDPVSKCVADHCTDQKRLFMTTQTRNGSNHSDFDSPMQWFIEPCSNNFTKPVVLLTSRHTVSAGENMTLAMRIIPHVTVVGDTTSGCFSNMLRREAPNGWQYTLSNQLFIAENGICYEGIGVSPDIHMVNYLSDISNNIDKVIEQGIDIICQ